MTAKWLIWLEKASAILLLICVLILGVLIGKYQERTLFNQKNAQIIPLNHDINHGVPFVRILGIKDGQLLGVVSGKEVRVMTETEVALLNDELDFTLEINDILRQSVLYDVPAGMNYLASRKGTRFYNIYSKEAAKIAPQNRLFFPTKKAALAAGYLEN